MEEERKAGWALFRCHLYCAYPFCLSSLSFCRFSLAEPGDVR